MKNELNIGDLIQLESGKIGMIVSICLSTMGTIGKYPPSYEVEWYHSILRPTFVSEYDVMTMRSRYLNFRDWVYERSNR